MSAIPAASWVQQYSTQGKSPNTVNEKVVETVEQTIKSTDFPEPTVYPQLDEEITMEEVMAAILNMKSNCSSTADRIFTQMLKAGVDILAPALTKLCNMIFTTGVFPLDCGCGYLTPIPKKGDLSLAKNYRGVTVTSNLSKVLTSILHSRLVEVLEAENQMNEFQFGFRHGRSTSDAIFCLRSLVDRSLAKKQKLYACFVDFRSAFPSVWRNALFYKLQSVGVGGRWLEALQGMYHMVRSCLRVGTAGLTEFFDIPQGLREGCVLSPTLFNFFVNDLPERLSRVEGADHPKLGEQTIPCLMYADDLCLFATSEQGLQKSLLELQSYCYDWQLTLNTEKTQVLVFNGAGRQIHTELKYKGTILESVREYVYLGIVFTSSGSFKTAQHYLQSKAMKAFGVLCRCFPRGMVLDVRLFMSLFDRLVVPILLYAVEAWGFQLAEQASWKCLLDKMHLRCCRYVLGVHKMASSAACLGELGRYPLQLVAQCRTVQFWSKIVLNSGLSYRLYLAVRSEMSNWAPNKRVWCRVVQYVLQRAGMSGLWDAEVPLDRYLIAMLRQTLQDQFIQSWHTALSMSEKLRTYVLFKQQFSCESYLSRVLSVAHRHALARFRISAHKLAVETGRYSRPIIALCERRCRQCNSGAVEDERHFLLSCPSFALLRKPILHQASTARQDFEHLSTQDRFVWLMQKEELQPSLAKFIEEAFSQRSNL